MTLGFFRHIFLDNHFFALQAQSRLCGGTLHDKGYTLRGLIWTEWAHRWRWLFSGGVCLYSRSEGLNHGQITAVILPVSFVTFASELTQGNVLVALGTIDFLGTGRILQSLMRIMFTSLRLQCVQLESKLICLLGGMVYLSHLLWNVLRVHFFYHFF